MGTKRTSFNAIYLLIVRIEGSLVLSVYLDGFVALSRNQALAGHVEPQPEDPVLATQGAWLGRTLNFLENLAALPIPEM